MSLRQAYLQIAQVFRDGGVAAPELDARLLLLAATALSLEDYVREPDRPVDGTAQQHLDGMVQRRIAGEPVSRILGKREFYGREFKLTDAVLDPRPDTEVLVEAALAAIPQDASASILDLGTGSGCILLTLLAERPRSTGLGVDISEAALAAAMVNAEMLGVAARARFNLGDWFAPVVGQFDVVVANPPYIRSGEIAGLAPEVRLHDPRCALDGGADGLDAYRDIAANLGSFLAPGGVCLFEVGEGQAETVRDLLAAHGLEIEKEGWMSRDLAGIPRCVRARSALRRTGAEPDASKKELGTASASG